MEKVYAAFLKLIEDHAVIMPDSWELFLQTHLHNDYVECHYYLVSHNNRTLFWLHEARACDLNMSPTYDLQEMGASCYFTLFKPESDPPGIQNLSLSRNIGTISSSFACTDRFLMV